MVRCSFCENVIKPATGKMYVRKDGKILYFCTNKCEKNTLKLKRKPVEKKWTKTHAKAKRGKKK